MCVTRNEVNPMIKKIRAGKDICLANKETLIAGGPAVLPLAREHGVNILPAKVYEGPVEGMVFAYWHDQHEDRMINKVTKDAIDPGSKEPEFKICAVQVKKVSGPKPLKPYIV